MMQTLVHLAPKSRGFHLITDELLSAIPELSQIKTGIAHFFIQHSSASLTINENADPDVRGDMERYFLHAIPEHAQLTSSTLWKALMTCQLILKLLYWVLHYRCRYRMGVYCWGHGRAFGWASTV